MITVRDGTLYQWDTGRVIEVIHGNNVVNKIDIYNGTTEYALVLETWEENNRICAKIPDIFLQTTNTISVYAVLVDGDDQRTVRSARISICGREKPEDYVYTPEEILRYENWKNLISGISNEVSKLSEENAELKEDLAQLCAENYTNLIYSKSLNSIAAYNGFPYSDDTKDTVRTVNMSTIGNDPLELYIKVDVKADRKYLFTVKVNKKSGSGTITLSNYSATNGASVYSVYGTNVLHNGNYIPSSMRSNAEVLLGYIVTKDTDGAVNFRLRFSSTEKDIVADYSELAIIDITDVYDNIAELNKYINMTYAERFAFAPIGVSTETKKIVSDCLSESKAYTDSKFTEESYIDSIEFDSVSSGYVQIDGTITPNESYKNGVVNNVKSGEVYYYSCNSGSNVRAYVIISADGTVKRYASKDEWNTSHVMDSVTIGANEDGCKLYINTIKTDILVIKKQKFRIIFDGKNLKDKSVTSDKIADYSWNYLHGKKWWAVGDSITFGGRSDIDENGRRKTYCTYIADRNRMDLKLDALSGRAMGVKEGRTDSFCLDGYYNNCPFDCPDYITIFLGTNDTEEVGTIDSTDISTFAGAYNKVLDYLTSTYPTAKIGIIPVYDMADKLGQMTVQIGGKWGVPVFDWDSHSFFYYRYQKNTVMERKRAAFMYFDGEKNEVHPIDAGYQFMSTMIESWMRTL